MAVAFRSFTAAQADANGAVSFSINKPAGVVAGDMLLLRLTAKGTDTSIGTSWTVPAGFTLIRNDVSTTATDNNKLWSAIYARVADGSEPASWTVGNSSTWSTGVGAEILAYSGGFSTVAAGVRASDATLYFGAVTTTITAPSVAQRVGEMVVRLYVAKGGGSGVSFTPPAGHTKRTDQNLHWSAFSYSTADVAAASGGTTGTADATLSAASGSHIGQTLTLGVNVAPDAPTGLSPSGTTINRANTNRFSWTFSDPDAGDSQSQYDLRYRLVGAATWTVVSGTTPNTFRDFVGGTFVAGDYEWQVRTYDALGEVGPYSSSAFFTAADPPAGPTITDPIAGQTISEETYTVAWSTPSQEAYQVRTVADAAGSPDATIVYTDTGEVTSTAARSRSVSFATNNRNEHVQVRVKTSGLWSTWISVNVIVSYTVPATPTVAVDETTVAGAIVVQASHPTPTGSQPTVTSVDVWRRVTAEGGDGIRVAADLLPTGLFTDWAVASGVGYSYRVRAYGTNGTSSWSAWSEEPTELAVIYGGAYA